MKGKWDITSNVIDGVKVWQVYRLKSIGEVDHAGNREYYNVLYFEKSAAQERADFMNEVEEE